ncbi:MAG: aminotransferase class III-fold pyridoxal phosphate-dependent enzyme [Myxococcales bacterium]|nr:aminotransferase class III-fold pyridoxal phosphate-dependent enzyme [Myxococcales bacterium]
MRSGEQETRAEALAALEARQRAEAPSPGAIVERETHRVRIPEGGVIAQSAAALERLYADDFVVREKKPQVIDTRRSWGPYLVSIDQPPMVILDACSQIATLTHGFAHPGIVRALHEGRFDECLWANPDTRVQPSAILDDFAAALRERAPAGLHHVSFVTAGGSEANEKALRIARLHAPPTPQRSSRDRVLAFKASFHGRTHASLMATWNPSKRGPFELRGFEAVFVEAELEAVERALAARGAELYAIIVEPMMAEGGDVYLPPEFFAGLVALARKHAIPLIADEVQTGFGTGGPFFWWDRLGLGDDEATAPDMITMAKKANLGIVLSRWPDPEAEHAEVAVASALRGLIQLEHVGDQAIVEERAREQLEALAARYPALIEAPRCAGTTFAFDLPDNAAQLAFVAQRFHRGYMVYGAGERTIRFRLGARWTGGRIKDLFARIEETLRRLGTPAASAWEPEGQRRKREGPARPRPIIRDVEEGDWGQIIQIERESYEPARQDSEAYLRRYSKGGLGLVAIDPDDQSILGFCFGGPVENYRDISGADQDPRLDRGEVFYSADITVSEAARGRGVGRALKRTQIRWASEHGFKFMSGRNRIGATDKMMRLNRSFGAYPVRILERQYEGNARAEYYYIPLGAPEVARSTPRARPDGDDVDLASGIQAPFGPSPEFMAGRELVGPVGARLTLSNFITPDVIDYAEHLRLMLPRGARHMLVTSSRDEMIDKALRCLRLSRPSAQLAVGLEGGYVGHTTAAARSLSDPRGFGPSLALFDWPRIPHPEGPGGIEATVEALDGMVAQAGAETLYGLVAEIVGERSGYVLGGEAAVALGAACRRHQLPLVLVETASGGYRNGAGPWAVDQLPPGVAPDLVLWYPGGQLGHVFVNDRYWIDKPLTLISTWDGDELSMIRAHEHLRAAGKLDGLAEASAALGELLEGLVPAHFAGTRVGGLGLYRTLAFEAVADAHAVRAACRRRGLTLGEGLPGTLIVAPPFTLDAAAIGGLRRRLNAALAAAAGGEGASA